ncbi:uncharacterized protein phf11 isoform X2 [Lepisosteus oculatus]|uniref:uncharacterized protein phf11 isoform X2 n=1 Tax=Lepisosteus oculatus TaxID=7918 RepID=UPI0035F51A5D
MSSWGGCLLTSESVQIRNRNLKIQRVKARRFNSLTGLLRLLRIWLNQKPVKLLKMDQNLFCGFCHLSKESSKTGSLLRKDDVLAHENCLIFSSALHTKNTPECDDLVGFLVNDVKKEMRRGRKLACFRCKKNGATVGCEIRKCKRSYHYLCAVRDNAELVEDHDNGIYTMYCEIHRNNQETKKRNKEDAVDDSSMSGDPPNFEEVHLPYISEDSNDDDNRSLTKRKRTSATKWKGEKKLRKAGSREYRRITDSEDERELTNSGQELVQPEQEKETPSPCQNKLDKGQETGRQTADDEQEPAVSGYHTMPRIVDGSVRSTFNGKDMIENGLQNKAVKNASVMAKEDEIGEENRDSDSTDCSESLLLPVHVVSVQDETEAVISVHPPTAEAASENPATFWRKCREAGCVEQIMNKLTATVTDISERIIADRASDEDYAFTMTVLEASGMLPNVLQEKERELKEQLENLKKEIDALRSSQHAINELKQSHSIKQESNSC